MAEFFGKLEDTPVFGTLTDDPSGGWSAGNFRITPPLPPGIGTQPGTLHRLEIDGGQPLTIRVMSIFVGITPSDHVYSFRSQGAPG